MTQEKIEGKFYPLTPQVARRLREAKLTAAEWRLWSYLVELDPFGDRYLELPDTLTIMQECDIKKSTFYAAIAKFQALELFDFQDKGILARNLAIPKNRKAVQEIGNNSEKSENCPRNRKAVQESERESFWEFGKKKAAQLPKPPELPLKWIESNFDELRSQWEKQNGIVRDSQNWENDPRRSEWIDKIRSLGFAAFIYENGSLDKQRKKFYEWANSNNLIWGNKL